MINKEQIQEEQYRFPYHHLTRVTDGDFQQSEHLQWGLMHASYIYDVTKQVELINPNTILDAGCGDGRLVSELERTLPAANITGIDISEQSLHFAKAFSTRSKFHIHDITAAPLDHRFDLCISIEVIEHIKPDSINSYVKNISESLSDGGHLILTTPTENIPTSKKHYQHFTDTKLRNYLEPHFIIKKVVYQNKMNFVYKVISRLLANKHFIIKNKAVNNLFYRLYIKYCFDASATNGSRICVIAQKANIATLT